VIDFHANNGTKIAIPSDPLTFVLSPVVGGEGRVRGMATEIVPKVFFQENETRPQPTEFLWRRIDSKRPSLTGRNLFTLLNSSLEGDHGERPKMIF
jgi:hypothetical protein